MFTSTIVLLSMFLLVLLTRAVFKARDAKTSFYSTQFFLPDRLFVSLILLVSFWVILLLILGARSLPENEKQTVVIIASLFAPFLSWWRQRGKGDGA